MSHKDSSGNPFERGGIINERLHIFSMIIMLLVVLVFVGLYFYFPPSAEEMGYQSLSDSSQDTEEMKRLKKQVEQIKESYKDSLLNIRLACVYDDDVMSKIIVIIKSEEDFSAEDELTIKEQLAGCIGISADYVLIKYE